MAPVTPASNVGERYWEGERGGVMTVMTGGVGVSERERETRGWAGSGASWAGWPLLFIFFFCFPFLFYF
jgi:hypothetical protein